MNGPATGEYFPTFKRMGRGLLRACKKTWKPLLGLVLVLALIHSAATFILGRRVEAKIAAIKARGEPVSLAELGLPRVPDDENGAVIYAQMFERLTGTKRDRDLDVIRRSIDPHERAAEPGLWEEARAILARHPETFDLIEQAAAKPRCQFAVNWEDGAYVLLPHLRPMRQISELLCAKALLEASDGHVGEAMDTVALNFRVAESFKDDPSLIGQLVRMAMLKIASNSLRETLEYGGISEAQARRLYDTLAQVDMYPGFDRATQGQRCMSQWVFDQIRKEPNALWELTSYPSDEVTPIRKALRRVLVAIGRPFLYASQMGSLEFWDKQIPLMRLPYREIGPHRAALEFDAIPLYVRPLSAITCPIFINATASRDGVAAQVAGSQILLALAAYKDRYGAYPATLDELKARLGWDIPKDVFSGRDFIYKRQGNGFLFYSIGPDLKDDGGRPRWPRSPDSRDENYDIVWQLDH